MIGKPFVQEKDGYALYPAKYIYESNLIDLEGYLVSEKGAIFSLKTNKFLKPSLDKDGYYKLCLYSSGKRRNCYVHRVVGSTFHGEQALAILKQGDMVFDHINRNRLDNDFNNIRPTTISINVRNVSEDTYKQRQENMKKNRDISTTCKKVVVDGYVFNSLSDASNYLVSCGIGNSVVQVSKNLSSSLVHNYKCYGKVVSYYREVVE